MQLCVCTCVYMQTLRLYTSHESREGQNPEVVGSYATYVYLHLCVSTLIQNCFLQHQGSLSPCKICVPVCACMCMCIYTYACMHTHKNTKLHTLTPIPLVCRATGGSTETRRRKYNPAHFKLHIPHEHRCIKRVYTYRSSRGMRRGCDANFTR
jgi:hypothetical protein